MNTVKKPTQRGTYIGRDSTTVCYGQTGVFSRFNLIGFLRFFPDGGESYHVVYNENVWQDSMGYSNL